MDVNRAVDKMSDAVRANRAAGGKATPDGDGTDGRIVGIDPGLNTTGYAVIESDGRKVQLIEAGVVRSLRNHRLESRLQEIHGGVLEVIENHSPRVMALEEVFSHYQRPKTAVLMGHARGVIVLAAARSRIPVHHYAATQIKNVLTGNGRAGKAQVRSAVYQYLEIGDLSGPDDVSDAIAIALCHAFICPPQSSFQESTP